MSQEINLSAAFVGLKFLPSVVAIGSNSINPKLVLHDDQIEYRALFGTDIMSYSALEKVDVYLNYRTANICITRQDSVFTFAGNLGDKAKLINVLHIVKGKNCTLTDKALKLLTEN